MDMTPALCFNIPAETPVQPDCSEQFMSNASANQNRTIPTLLHRCGKPPALWIQNVQTSELVHTSQRFVDPGSCADVCLDKQFRLRSLRVTANARGADRRAAVRNDDDRSPTPYSHPDKDALSSELASLMNSISR
jgi:hypothetical protein